MNIYRAPRLSLKIDGTLVGRNSLVILIFGTRALVFFADSGFELYIAFITFEAGPANVSILYVTLCNVHKIAGVTIATVDQSYGRPKLSSLRDQMDEHRTES